MLVTDASPVVDYLLDDGPRGVWSAERMASATSLHLNVKRYPSTRLPERIWGLRETLTPYDAAYVALAEALDLPLATTDRGLARAHGHRAEIVAYEN